MTERINLKEATNFHGHLGPYLVLGILAGELALKRLGCKKYFGLNVLVHGANKKPKSCLIDGLQLSTGATYGKGNIYKFDGSVIKIEIQNQIDKKRIVLKLNKGLIKKLRQVRTHRDSELLAKELYSTDYSKIFNLTLATPS